MIVVKVGGSEGIDYDAVCEDVAQLIEAGQQLVLVHGGSHLTNEVAAAIGPSAGVCHLGQRLQFAAHRSARAGNFRDGLLRPGKQGSG